AFFGIHHNFFDAHEFPFSYLCCIRRILFFWRAVAIAAPQPLALASTARPCRGCQYPEVSS
ncbi:MAG: hypothetical protein ACKN9U_02380, partial [Pirellulaceae bacterium]